nr:DUF6056 family protein [uncultured Acetatifactor sp.]
MIQKFREKKYILPYILLAAFLFAMFCMVTEPTRDDFYYQSIEAGSAEDLFAFLSQMYSNWSSRMVTEPLVVLLVNVDMMVWRLFCVVNILIIALSIRYLLEIRDSVWKNSVLCMLVGAFPFSHYASAGWITTTGIYLISISLGLVALFPLRKFLDGKRSAWWENALYILSAILSCNHEQVGAVVLGVYLCSCIYCAVLRKKICRMQICQIVISIASILFVLTCPGDAVRMVIEAQTWLPEHADWTFFEKLMRGFFHASDYYFYTSGINFAAFTLVFLLSLILLTGPAKKWKKAVSVAVSLWLSLAVGIILLQRFQVLAPDTFFPWEEYGVNMLTRGVDVARAASGTVLLFLIFCELFWLFGNSLSFWTASMFLAAGFGSAAVLGFSPTIYASGNRVFSIYLYATIILVCYIVNQCFDHKCGKKECAALFVTGIFSLASTAKNIWLVAGA